MNTNTAVIGGVVIVLLLVGGLFLYTQNNTGTGSPTATSTPTGTVDNTGGTPAPRQAGAPSATTNPSVISTDTTAVVVGGVVPNGAFTDYWYEYGTSALSGKTQGQHIGSGYGELPAPAYITGLTKDTTYSFRLVAQNQYGKAAGATYTFRTTVGTPPPVGSAPTAKTLAATGITRTAANLNGEVTPNKVSTQFWFEYGETQNLGLVSTLQQAGSGSVKVPESLALSNLAPATTYYFRLNAQNSFGTTNGSILSFKTSGPPLTVAVPVVTTQVAGPVATTTATLRGTVNPVGAQTTYWFEYSANPGFGQGTLKTTSQGSAGAGADTLSIETAVSSLASQTTYYYRMAAQNAGGIVRGAALSFKTK